MAARLTAYLVVAIVAATFIAGLIVGAQRDDSDGPVDLIVRNATVYTADRRGTMAEAVAVRGNQILRVGTNREVDRLQRPQTVIVDARGGAVLPGFNDAHVQLGRGGLSLTAVDLARAGSVTETLERISEWAAAHPGSPWIVGRGWTPERFRNGLPSRQLLDSVVADRPVLMFGADERTVWANSIALRAADVTRRTPDPSDGAIVREPRTGEPAGVLRGSAAELVTKLIPPPSREQRAAALLAAIGEANALGITSVQTAGDPADSYELYDALRRSGELTLRIYSAIPISEPVTDRDLDRLDAVRRRYPDDPLFKSGALSIRLDGTIPARAAAMLEPYAGGTASDGAPIDTSFAADDLNRTVRLADSAGWQIITHATGDRAVRMALNAYAHAVRSNRLPPRGRRHRIESLAVVDPADVPRFEPLGIVASIQPRGGHPTEQGIAALSRQLGDDRAARAFASSRLAETTRVVFGSGWPASELDPLLGLHAVTTRTTAESTPEGGWQAAERLELKPAVDAYTSSAAWASFDDQRKGSIAPGMLADMVVLSEDIFETPAEKLPTVSVAVTIFDGKIVYRRLPRSETEPVAVQ